MSLRLKLNRTKEAQLFHSSNQNKWLPYLVLGGRKVNNAQTTDISIDKAKRDVMSESVTLSNYREASDKNLID